MVSLEMREEFDEALSRQGVSVATSLRPMSVEHLLREDERRAKRRFGKVHESIIMRQALSPVIDVAIDPRHAILKGTGNQTLNMQHAMIQAEQTRWKGLVPEHLGSLVSLRMLDPSGYAQLEDAVIHATGSLLFTNFYARTATPTYGDRRAHIGRSGPTDVLRILDWYGDLGRGNVFAVPVFVLPSV